MINTLSAKNYDLLKDFISIQQYFTYKKFNTIKKAASKKSSNKKPINEESINPLDQSVNNL